MYSSYTFSGKVLTIKNLEKDSTYLGIPTILVDNLDDPYLDKT